MNVNVVDPFSRKVLEGKEIEKRKRKEERNSRLFDIGKKCLNGDGMTREELVRLKITVIWKLKSI